MTSAAAASTPSALLCLRPYSSRIPPSPVCATRALSTNLIRITPRSISARAVKSAQSPATSRSQRVLSDGRDGDDDLGRPVCPGCGVFMQDSDPDFPGFYRKPARSLRDSYESLQGEGELEDEFDELDGDETTSGADDYEESDEEVVGISPSPNVNFGDGFDEDFDWEDEDEKRRKELDGFGPPGVGYGNVTEEILRATKEKISKSEKKKRMREERMRADGDEVLVCARCHSLRNYGQVKNQKAENLIPDFDFDRLVTAHLMKPSAGATVVVMVVDCVDFDGSFPRRAAKSLFKALEAEKESKMSKLPKLVLVATKVDLLPSQVSPARLDKWVRSRARAAGAPKLNAVYLVSARKDLGVRNLISCIKELAGPRGNVWVIGAQNAGKSTLINSFAKKESTKIAKLTEASVPGTTLGIVRIMGILPAKAKLYDTPGLLHPYLMTMRLNREEQKMVEIRKELRPCTFRVKAGQTIHVGGLMRLDIVQASVETIYVTVWVSPNVSLHSGKIENAEELRNNHFGVRLQPPVSKERIAELRPWKPLDIAVSGISWDVNSLDIAVSGLGWFSLGLKGKASVVLWTFDDVEVTQREPLVLDRAPFNQRPGFLLPKAISDALGEESRRQAKSRRQAEEHLLLQGQEY